MAGQQGDGQAGEQEHPHGQAKQPEAGQGLEQHETTQGEGKEGQADGAAIAGPGAAQPGAGDGDHGPDEAEARLGFPAGMSFQRGADEAEPGRDRVCQAVGGAADVGHAHFVAAGVTGGLQGGQQLDGGQGQGHRGKQGPETEPAAQAACRLPPAGRLSEGRPQRPQHDEDTGVERPLGMSPQQQQGEGRSRGGGPAQAALPQRPFQAQHDERQPDQPNHDDVARGEQMEQQLPREHVAGARDECPGRAQPLLPGIAVGQQPAHQDVQHDQPAENGPEVAFRNKQQRQVGRVEDADLDVVDERCAAEAVGAPQGYLAGFPPGPGQEVLVGQVHGQDVGVVAVEGLPGMSDQRPEEQQGQGKQQSGREEARGHGNISWAQRGWLGRMGHFAGRKGSNGLPPGRLYRETGTRTRGRAHRQAQARLFSTLRKIEPRSRRGSRGRSDPPRGRSVRSVVARRR